MLAPPRIRSVSIRPRLTRIKILKRDNTTEISLDFNDQLALPRQDCARQQEASFLRRNDR